MEGGGVARDKDSYSMDGNRHTIFARMVPTQECRRSVPVGKFGGRSTGRSEVTRDDIGPVLPAIVSRIDLEVYQA